MMKKNILQFAFLSILTFAAGAQPVISSFTPISGPIGTSVTITGTNFDASPANNIVFFGATKAVVTAASSTELTVTVPPGATYLPITVLTNGLMAYSNAPFVVTFMGDFTGTGIDVNSFEGKVDFTTNGSAVKFSIADLDGDGKADLAVANSNSNSISVFRNTSTSGTITTGSFTTKVDFITGSGPNDVAIGDLDGDGKPDLVVANYGDHTISVFRNTSTSGSITTGSFDDKVDFTTGTGPIDVTIRDLDGDGKADLAVANLDDNSVSVFRNTSASGISSSSFAAKVDFTTGAGPRDVASGDLDGDGKADLAVANSGNSSVSVLRNTATSGSITTDSFDTKVDFTAGTRPYDVAIGDLDGDGKADLAVPSWDNNSVSVFRNTSTSGSITTGSFDAKVDFATGSVPLSVSIGDLDGDSRPDLAITNFGSGSVSILKNNSTSGSITTGSFNDKVDYITGTNPWSVSIGDLDGDGKADLVVANLSSNSVSVFRNAIVSFTPTITSFSPSSGPINTAVTIAGTNFDSTPTNNIVLFGATQATVTAATTTELTIAVPAGATYEPITVLTNGLMAYSKTPFVITFPGDGTGIDVNSYDAKVDITTGLVPQSVSIGDLDGDGKADLAVTSHDENYVSVLRNTSSPGSITTGSFNEKIDFTTGTFGFPTSVAIGDLDRDGKLDLVVGKTDDNTVSVFRNTSTTGTISAGSFAPKFDITTETPVRSVAIGDLDGDGKPDIVVANKTNNFISVFRNTSTPGTITTGSFAPNVDFAAADGPWSVSIGDLDGDGKADLALANNNDNIVSVYRNTSTPGTITTGSFAPRVDFTTTITGSPTSVSIGDLDGDDKADLVVTNEVTNTVSVLRNTSSPGSITGASFATNVDFTTGLDPESVSIGDLDGDGKVDLAVTNRSDNTVSVFRNTSTAGAITTGSFAGKVDFTAGSDPRSVTIGDLDGDGKADLVVANSSNGSVSIFRRHVVPQTPIATVASSIAQTAFMANWETSLGATGYYLDVSTTNNFSIGTFVTGFEDLSVGNVTSYPVNNNLDEGTTYYYRVRASDGIPVSTNSNTIEITTVPPEPVLSATTDITQTSFSANWIAATSATGYILDVTTDAGFSAHVTGSPFSVGNVLVKSVTDLNAGINYHYRVRAVNAAGTSGNSGAQSLLTIPPDPVSSKATDISQTSFSANWASASSATDYTLDVSTDAEFTMHITGSPFAVGNLLTKSITGLLPGINYYYRVRAVNATGTSGNSGTQTLISIPPNPVSSEASNISQNSFSANWEATTSATGYLLDVAEDAEFSEHFTGSPFTVGNFSTKSIAGLTAATNYYYRVRAVNTGGTSGNSDTQTLITVPDNPNASPAAGITTNSFQATWNSVAGADYYIVEVSADDFSSLILRDSLTFELFLDVTGLSENTQYKYRVQSGNISGVSGYSNTITVVTLTNQTNVTLAISDLTFDDQLAAGETSAGISFSPVGGTGHYVVTIRFKRILDENFKEQIVTPDENGTYSLTFDATDFDDFGLTFEIIVTDGENTVISDQNFIYRSFEEAESPPVPFERFGGTIESWNLFTIPFELENRSISSIFTDLDPERHEFDWRIMRYRNSSNDYVNFNTGQVQIGEAYWFNSKENVTVKIGGGKTNSQIPFQMNLVQGWNLIGNPYNITISWNKVLEDNGNPAEVGQLQIFNGTNQSAGNVMNPFTGGFVFADSPTTITIDPSTAANGRYLTRPSEKIRNHEIDQREWILHLNLENEGKIERVGGLGMHPEANLLKDEYDQMALPRFVFYNDLYTMHEDYFYPWFSTDIVPSRQSHSWSFQLASNKTEGLSKLTWDHQALGNNEAQLTLLDKQTGQTVDMKTTASYTINLQDREFSFEIFYSLTPELPMAPEEAILGDAFPSPAESVTTIPLAVPRHSGMTAYIRLVVFDLQGNKVKTLIEEERPSGFYQIDWNLTNEHSGRVSNGLYFYRVEIAGQTFQKRLIVR